MIGYGEDPAASAERELAEELGISGTELTSLGLSVYEDDTTRCVEHCFTATWGGPVRHADGEVVWGAWMSLPELDDHLADPEWAFVPDTRALAAPPGEGRRRRLRHARLTGRWCCMSDDGSDRAVAAAEHLGLRHVVTRHGPVRSLAEAAAARGVEPRAIVKTIVVRVSDGDYRLVLVPGDREIAWPKLRALLGVNRLSMPSADVAFEVTGYVRGTITPLGSTTAWPVVADASLSGEVSIGGGAHGVALTVDAGELVTALGATVADVTEPSS